MSHTSIHPQSAYPGVTGGLQPILQCRGTPWMGYPSITGLHVIHSMHFLIYITKSSLGVSKFHLTLILTKSIKRMHAMFIYFIITGPLLHMWSIIDQNVIMRYMIYFITALGRCHYQYVLLQSELSSPQQGTNYSGLITCQLRKNWHRYCQRHLLIGQESR